MTIIVNSMIDDRENLKTELVSQQPANSNRVSAAETLLTIGNIQKILMATKTLGSETTTSNFLSIYFIVTAENKYNKFLQLNLLFITD